MTINVTGEPLPPAEAHHRPRFLGCTRIDGSISISDTSDYPIDTVEVILEGLVTTWVKHNNPRAIFSSSTITRQRILHMTDVKLWQGFVREVTANGDVKWSSAFHFEIPQIMFEPFPDWDEDSLPCSPFAALLPSVSIRTVDFGASNFESYDQGGCHVVYSLRAQSISKGICIEKSHLELDIFPRASPLPPLDTQDFPGEYRLTGLKALHNGLIPKKCGVLTIGTREPRPLELCQHTDTASTKIALDFQFKKSSSGPRPEPPMFSDCDVTTTLKAFTFVSTSKQMSAPTMRQSISSPGLVQIVRCLSRQTHKFHFPIWCLSRHNNHVSDSILPEAHPEVWETHLSLVVTRQIDQGLLVPTFTSSLVNRRYILEVNVQLRGRQHVRFELAVPLQVVHMGTCRKGNLPEFLATPIETQAEYPLLAADSASASNLSITSDRILSHHRQHVDHVDHVDLLPTYT